MRPVHIVVLLLAGALGGALIMKAVHQGKPAVPAAAVAQLSPPATAPLEPPESAPAAQAPSEQPEPAQAVQTPPAEPEPAPATVPEKAKPSPMPLPVRRETAKPQRYRPVMVPPAADPEPVERPTPPPAAEPAPAPPATSPTIAPPPATTEPEHATLVTPQVSVAPAVEPHQVTLNAGLLLPVRLVDGMSSERNVPGDAFLSTLDQELVADGFVIAERGAQVEGRVVAVDRGGKTRGVAALAVELTRLYTSDGQVVAIQTDSFFKHADGNGNHGDAAAKVAGGAIIGAMIGAIAGGGKGAAIGAGVGGGAGAGDVMLTRAKPAELPSETRVTFRLKAPVALTEKLR